MLHHLLRAMPIAAVLTAAIAVSAPAQTVPRVTEQQSGTTQLLQAVHAVNDSVVWASGHGGVVLRTLDGGRRWEQLKTPAGDSLEFRDVHAFSADTAWILSAGDGPQSRIYRTTNGGVSWRLQFINRDSAAFYDCLSFGTPLQGVAYGDASQRRTNLLRTVDGGATWTLLSAASAPAPLPGEGAFASSGQCVVHADSSTVFVATGAPGARLFRSRDAGRSWTVENTPFTRGTAAGLTGMAFRNAQRGIAVAADINRLRTDSSQAVVGVTNDGGRNWELRPRPPFPGALSGVAWVRDASSRTAVLVGFGGAFFTTDEARSYTVLTDRVVTGVSSSGRTVWMSGAGGRIWRVDF
jgi:photosystem II stability/assembly factor-like uncharacterized protein